MEARPEGTSLPRDDSSPREVVPSLEEVPGWASCRVQAKPGGMEVGETAEGQVPVTVSSLYVSCPSEVTALTGTPA